MSNGSGEKMQMIGSAIIQQAEQQQKQVIEEANRLREQSISACKDQMIERMFGEIQGRTRVIRQKAIRDKARVEQDARRELLRRRMELTDMVFAEVRARLTQYAATERYRNELVKSISAYSDRCDHSATTVQLREADMSLAGEIEQLMPGCRVESARAIRFGGFRLRDTAAGVLYDETLDHRLEEQRPWFLQNCGMKITL